MKILRGSFSTIRWRTRLTLWGAAACAGLAVVIFTKLADIALSTFFLVAGSYPWAPFISAPLTGVAAVWLTRRYFKGAQGSGIPQVIAATRYAAHGAPVDGLVSLRARSASAPLHCLADFPPAEKVLRCRSRHPSCISRIVSCPIREQLRRRI